MSERDDKKLTGLDALEEITRRLQDLAGAAFGGEQGRSSSGSASDGSHTEKSFTFETSRGPIHGIMGMTVRNLAEMARDQRRPTAAKQRPAARRTAPASPAPERLIDIFEEEQGLLVIIDAQGEEAISVSAELAGSKLVLRNTKDGSVFETIELPRDTAECYAATQINNGIIEVRIARLQRG